MRDGITLFDNAEEAWFWFINATTARESGAKIRANEGLYKRPCEPSDIMKILERLHRHRRLDMHHFRVLKHYGLRMIAPDITRAREVLAARLWNEAMDILSDVFISKGIIERSFGAEIIDFPIQNHAMEAQAW